MELISWPQGFGCPMLKPIPPYYTVSPTAHSIVSCLTLDKAAFWMAEHLPNGPNGRTKAIQGPAMGGI